MRPVTADPRQRAALQAVHRPDLPQRGLTHSPRHRLVEPPRVQQPLLLGLALALQPPRVGLAPAHQPQAAAWPQELRRPLGVLARQAHRLQLPAQQLDRLARPQVLPLAAQRVQLVAWLPARPMRLLTVVRQLLVLAALPAMPVEQVLAAEQLQLERPATAAQQPAMAALAVMAAMAAAALADPLEL